MRNRFVAAVTLLSFLGATGLPVVALGAGNGNVESVSGQVLVQSGQQWEALQTDDLPVGVTVRTGEDGQAIVRLGTSRLRVAANSQFRVVSIGDNSTEVALERGRVLGRAGDKLVVTTEKSTTNASRGEFVLETNAQGSALRVLSGDARLSAEAGQPVTFGGLQTVPSQEAATLSTVGDLGKVSAVGDVALLGEWRTKGKGVRIRNTDETVGGEEDASPDQDIPAPRQPEPPIVENPPPTTPTPPPTTPTPPPTTPTPPPAAGGGIGAGFIIGGLALVGGIVALVAGGDDDDDNVFVPGNPGVPSPALP